MRVHKLPSAKHSSKVPPLSQCPWAALLLLTVGHFHGSRAGSGNWEQPLWLNQGQGGAASPDQSIHLPNREIVSLVSKVMLIFGPFHLLDATAVSIPHVE